MIHFGGRGCGAVYSKCSMITISEHLFNKRMFSLGHCPSYLSPPPPIRATWSFFLNVKNYVVRVWRNKIVMVVEMIIVMKWWQRWPKNIQIWIEMGQKLGQGPLSLPPPRIRTMPGRQIIFSRGVPLELRYEHSSSVDWLGGIEDNHSLRWLQVGGRWEEQVVTGNTTVIDCWLDLRLYSSLTSRQSALSCT